MIVIAILLIAGGIVFSILPPLPGPLLTYGALVSAHYISSDTSFSAASFIIWAIIGVLILVLDYTLPAVSAKKSGGTKAGMIGGLIGTVAGVILPIPFGIIIGPFLGAVIGDLCGGNSIKSAFRSGFGSFLGFLASTSLKLIYSIVLGSVIAWKVGGFTFNAIRAAF